MFGMPMVSNRHVLYSNGAFFGPFPAGTHAIALCDSGFHVQGYCSF